ncbi:helix-turn-helix transcriptional regulator [Flavobacterium oreochromis]|uniref:helix-turn-helix domain-containing protein n=1 Tax=Flavobacterium oreochromis TaxID=2906078 RepID=UPI00385A1D20
MSNFNSMLYKLLGGRIKTRREELEMNQSLLGEKSKIGRASISNIEKGRQKPPLSVIYRICHELDIDVHSVLPTYKEIEAAVEAEGGHSSLKLYLEKANLDENLQKEIDSLFKDKTDDI